MEKQQLVNEITELLYNYTKKEHIMASKVILEEYAKVLVENGYGKSERDNKCKLGLEKVKMSNCQECPYFEECYIEQLEEISDGKKQIDEMRNEIPRDLEIDGKDINIICEILTEQGYRKQEWISVEDGLPEEGEFVLVWCGKIEIARIRKGITEEQRQKMRNGELPNTDELYFSKSKGYHYIKRSETIKECDLWGNNLVPYCWEVQGGLKTIFGQDISHWMPLPTPPKMKGAE